MTDFVDSLHETFAPIGRITPRRMFGGHGIFHEGRMIAIVIRDALYLKSDADSAPFFDRLDLKPFTYERQGKQMPMSYRQAPPEFFEDRHEALVWGRRAYEAALRSGQAPKPKKPAAGKPAAKKAAAQKKAPVKKPPAKKAPVNKTARKAAAR